MRAFRAGFAAIAFGAAFAAGCSQQGSGALGALDIDAKSVEAFATKLAGETFKGKATAAADIAGVRDALPKDVTISWGNLSFDAATGSTLLTDVKLSPKDMPQVGLGIQELRLFDFDAEFAKARLAGQRLTETAPLASRIDAKGVSLFGLAAMMNSMSGIESVTVLDPAAPADPTAPADGAQPEDGPQGTEPSFEFDEAAFATNFERYDFSFSRVIVNDLVLRPYEVAAPAAADATAPNGLGMSGPEAAIFQQYIGVARSFGVDTVASYDMKGDMVMTQMGQKIAATFGAKSSATRGWRGGDFDAGYVRDMAYKIDVGASELMQSPAMNFEYAVGYLGMEDLHFDKLYGYLAKGVMPPRTETNLISFGSYLFENQKVNVAGKELMSIGESTLDAREFHWFIPTKITGTAKNAVFDIAAMMEMAESAAGAYAGDPSDPMAAEMAAGMPDIGAIKAALEKNGFAKPNLNFNFGWNWNATSGDAKVDLGFGGEKLMQLTTKFEGGFPSFKAVSALIPEDPMQANEAAIAQLFDEKSTLKLVDINVNDDGGLDKMFNLVADLGPIMAAGDPAGNPMEGQTGASLRQMAGGMLTMLGATPEFAPYINPLSNFIMQGGKLHIGLKPAQPMTWTALSESLMGAGMADPAAQLKQLGLKVEHSK